MNQHPSKAELLSVLDEAYDAALRAAKTTSHPDHAQLIGRLAEYLAEERTILADASGVDYPSDEEFDLEFRSGPNEAELLNLANALIAIQDKTATPPSQEPAFARAVTLTRRFLQLLTNYRRRQN